MKVVLNATPLIYLVKSGLYHVAKDLDLDYISTKQVVKEVLIPTFPEYSELKDFLEKYVKISEVKITKEFAIESLGEGEASVLSLAKANGFDVILDDKLARACAVANGVQTYHTTFLIFRALQKNKISKTAAVGYLDKLVLSGWRCDIETYVRIK